MNPSMTSMPDMTPSTARPAPAPHRPGRKPLYTPQERARRDASRWTMWQGVLAPVQLLVCLVSLVLVSRWLATGQGGELATASVLLKTGLLAAIMITGCLWEHDVYGQYLFAPAFFWEDFVSMYVILMHVIFLLMWLGGAPMDMQFKVAVAAYVLYIVNAAQFLLKLRAARKSPGLVAA